MYNIEIKIPKTKKEAREQAIDWQNEFVVGDFDWLDLVVVSVHFEKIAKKFKLTEEFKENGII